jgi:phage/plasmid-associated DNA primase
VQPKEVVEATRRWQAKSNVLASFVEECTTQHPDAYVPVKEFLSAFNEYAAENGQARWTQDRLSKTLARAPFWVKVGRPRINSVQTRCYMGLSLHSPH